MLRDVTVGLGRYVCLCLYAMMWGDERCVDRHAVLPHEGVGTYQACKESCLRPHGGAGIKQV